MHDDPFAPACPRARFVETRQCVEVLRRLDEGLGAREPFLVITGEPGTGKTTLVREAVARWGARAVVAFVAYPALSESDLLEECLRRFGAEPPQGASRPRLIAGLERALVEAAGGGRTAVLVVDDAHLMPAEGLEALRLLANTAGGAGAALEILLAGLPSLDARLDEPSLAALRQRIAVRARLEPLSPEDTRRYVNGRLGTAEDAGPRFSDAACAVLAARAYGVPRAVNALAGEALRRATEAGASVVEAAHVPGAVGASPVAGEARTVRRESSAEAAAPAPVEEPGGASPRASDAPPCATANAAAGPFVRAAGALEPAPARDAREASRPGEPRPVAAAQDPRAWVARFVGDRGPVRIGALAGITPADLDDLDAPGHDETSVTANGPAAERARRAARRVRQRPRARPGVRVAAPLALVALAALSAVALVVRAGWRAGEVGAGEPGASGRPAAVASAAPATPAGAPQAVRSATVAPTRAMLPAASARLESAPLPAPPFASPTAVAAAPAPVSAAQADSGGTPEAPPPALAERRGPFTVEVAASHDPQAAFDERGRLEDLTGIEGWVIPPREGSDGPHRIVLGIYGTYERARRAADMLVNTRTLGAAEVVPLPPARDRR